MHGSAADTNYSKTLVSERNLPSPEENSRKEWIAIATRICQEAARGNLELRLSVSESEGEFSELARAINYLLDVVDAFVREAGASLDYAAHGKFFRRVLLRGLLGSFRNAAVLINNATGAMEKNAQALKGAEQRRLTLADDFEGAIKEVVASVASAATQLSTTAAGLKEMAKGTTDRASAVATASEQSSLNVKTVADATDLLGASVRSISDKVHDSTSQVGLAVKEASRSNEIVQGLSAASKRIGGVVKLISEVASQTNLLALNASIEAARAGESGKGFAVVAGEVKELARQTSAATDDISQEIKAIQQASLEAATAITSIGTTIASIDQLAGGISHAVNEQRSATVEIGKNVNEAALATLEVSRNIADVSQASRETTVSAEQVTLAATALSAQAEMLKGSVENFLAELRSGPRKL